MIFVYKKNAFRLSEEFVSVVPAGKRHSNLQTGCPFAGERWFCGCLSCPLLAASTLRRAQERTSRKPMLLFRLFGLLLFRYAERRFLPSLFQLPPRFTRLVPVTALLLQILFFLNDLYAQG